MSRYSSWGRYPALPPDSQRILPLPWRTSPLPATSGPLLPYGEGRSYGDSCLNEGGTLIPTRGLDRFMAFDAGTGVLTCEAGVRLDEILRLVAAKGWFLPVTPGTQFVTVGGAIANDVHGKNHHAMGTFGRHVRRLELLRSDGSRRVCSPTEHPDYYGATIGGLGLTGVILWAELQLLRMHNPFILQEALPLENLETFFAVNRESERDFHYTVAWVDCLQRGKRLGRGVYYRGNHAPPKESLPRVAPRTPLAVPFELPGFTLNRLTVGAFNWLYRWMNLRGPAEKLVHYQRFFYPLDSIRAWNRIYGRQGLLQFQCVVPEVAGGGAMVEILDRIAHSHQASFLAVLKTFGDLPSPGWMSFPRPGVTLALDFPNRGERTRELFAQLEAVTLAAGGALYPAKDALMSAQSFAACYPALERFRAYVDPAFSSSFWRRVTS